MFQVEYRLEFWQPHRFVYDKKPKLFFSMYEHVSKTEHFSKRAFFASKGSYGRVAPSFDSPNKVILAEDHKFFFHFRKKLKKTYFFPQKSIFNGNTESNFGHPVDFFSTKSWVFLLAVQRSSEKFLRFSKTKFRLQNVPMDL